MPRNASNHPTEFELEILKLLWTNSPQTVSSIRDGLAGGGRKSAHTSVITILNIMVTKGYVKKRKLGKSYEYWPVVSESDVSQLMVGDMVNRLFDGSAKHMMLNLLDQEELTEEELVELRKLINRKVREQKS